LVKVTIAVKEIAILDDFERPLPFNTLMDAPHYIAKIVPGSQ
jgi:hypothetical protein